MCDCCHKCMPRRRRARASRVTAVRSHLPPTLVTAAQPPEKEERAHTCNQDANQRTPLHAISCCTMVWAPETTVSRSRSTRRSLRHAVAPRRERCCVAASAVWHLVGGHWRGLALSMAHTGVCIRVHGRLEPQRVAELFASADSAVGLTEHGVPLDRADGGDEPAHYPPSSCADRQYLCQCTRARSCAENGTAFWAAPPSQHAEQCTRCSAAWRQEASSWCSTPR